MWKDLPTGLATSICLMVTPESRQSVLNAPLPESAPLENRKEIPYVIAVSKIARYPRPQLAPGEEAEDVFGRDFKGYFDVTVESLLRNLYPLVALDIMDLPRLTINMQHDKDMWFDTSRGGIRHYMEESNTFSSYGLMNIHNSAIEIDEPTPIKSPVTPAFSKPSIRPSTPLAGMSTWAFTTVCFRRRIGMLRPHLPWSSLPPATRPEQALIVTSECACPQNKCSKMLTLGRYYVIQSGDNCVLLENEFGITMAQLQA
ncbi:hypothetical protein TSTA_041160 [Talaromyces stipitatus ATCC 10500]|uniref:LysM domain-containing protein n=1 Tax=Talaromyces stipitatus (strain ATCC 10500 / CBS 375.48 / QM 6759 / NRRL 1006) TaxID=441959 RepID=B8MIF4_TALSN|nr:uncharacterized protein TSTA_041160 [Talaromyces stipitatus ATCC 10500]EED14638.1 hypothetical protein TSTA_041160 [Talaromyces stipitatus ATCC 10500]